MNIYRFLHRSKVLTVCVLGRIVLVGLLFSAVMAIRAQSPKLVSGDLLFVSASSSGLSGAIDAVTQTDTAHHFVHVAMVERQNSETWVLHADSEEGVMHEPLADFLADRPVVVAYRIQGISKTQIDQALEVTTQVVGQPYNHTYVMSDTGYYCSELIYEAFSPTEVFDLNPMTFLDPKTGSYHPTWVHHYDSLGIPIPQGKPGCNPNGMAASPRLKLLGKVDL